MSLLSRSQTGIKIRPLKRPNLPQDPWVAFAPGVYTKFESTNRNKQIFQSFEETWPKVERQNPKFLSFFFWNPSVSLFCTQKTPKFVQKSSPAKKGPHCTSYDNRTNIAHAFRHPQNFNRRVISSYSTFSHILTFKAPKKAPSYGRIAGENDEKFVKLWALFLLLFTLILLILNQ